MVDVVVVNASAAVLAGRAVASAADGAAVAAAQALDEGAVRSAGLSGQRLPLSQSGARERVAAYARQMAPTQPGLTLTVTVDGGTASVVAVRDVRLPFARLAYRPSGGPRGKSPGSERVTGSVSRFPGTGCGDPSGTTTEA